MLKLYRNIDKINRYSSELETIDKEIKLIEKKKTMTLDLVFLGKLQEEVLKTQFEQFEKSIGCKTVSIIRQ